jgi:hypothetical protein
VLMLGAIIEVRVSLVTVCGRVISHAGHGL